MTAYGRQHEYEEVLRTALQAAGDSIQPAADGLERISHRLTVPRPLPLALVIAWLDLLYRSLTVTLPSAAEETWEALLPARKRARHAAAWIIWLAGGEARRPVAAGERGKSREPSQSPFGRMRPAAAMFVAIFVVAAAGYVFFVVPQTLSGQAISWLPWYASPAKTVPTQSHDRGAGNGPSSQPGQPSGGPSSGSTRSSGTNCTPANSSGPPSSTQPSTSTSGSPSPSPSTSSTSPSPSTTPTGTPSGSDSPSAGGGSSPTTPGATGTAGTMQTSRQLVIPKTRTNVRRPRHRHRHKKHTGCTRAFVVPVTPHRGSAAVSLSAAQFIALSRDPAGSSSL
jgi:hypothetical protein